MPRQVEHQITLFAMTRIQGELSLFDMVETSHRHAARFASRWLRDSGIAAIGTARPEPGSPIHFRDIPGR